MTLITIFLYFSNARADVVGSVYALDTEYSGDSFFDGFDFQTVSGAVFD